jgi:Mat/Ecp fimbriae major subunit
MLRSGLRLKYELVSKGTIVMKTMLKVLAGTAAIALALGSNAAQAATANADARATILTQVTVVKTSDLDFVTPAGAGSCTAGLVCSGTKTAANFTVTGVVGQTVGITLPANVTLTSGTNSMTATLNSSATSILLDGTDAFSVGGDLAVSATQAAGAYLGTFTATVNYQ